MQESEGEETHVGPVPRHIPGSTDARRARARRLMWDPFQGTYQVRLMQESEGEATDVEPIPMHAPGSPDAGERGRGD
jgi:hypothetical protein